MRVVIDSPPLAAPAQSMAAGREPGRVPAGRRHLRWLAIGAAAVLHLSPALLLVNWPRIAPPVPPPIPVSLVLEKPPAPPPPPPAKPAPQQAPDPAPLRSGADLTTTAPPQGEAETAHEDSKAVPEESAPPPGVTPLPGTGEKETAMLDPGTAPRPAEKPAAPAKAPPAKKRADKAKPAAPGERVTNGDPYFNALAARMRQRYSYPEMARPLGLKGLAVYVIRIDRAGRLLSLDLLRSAGAEMLDKAGAKTIRDTAPFPPPPAYIPGDVITIYIDLPMVPE
jgi:TonB family protein